jgi:aerobic carbon-monoxide dehydrogenase large subunit
MGTRVERREDPRFLRGEAAYVADLDDPLLAGAAAVVFVRSTAAHATIRSVDVDDARSAPGVLAVVTAADVDLAVPPGRPVEAMARPWLADGTVRWVGEPVVAIVAEDETAAADAADLVVVDYDPLPVVVDPEQAATDEILLFPEAGTNVARDKRAAAGDELFDGCEVVVRFRTVNQRVAPVPMEGRAAAATWDRGRLVHFSSTQAAHFVKGDLVERYGLDDADVRVIAPDVGGGFGAKITAFPDELLLPWLARRVGRPVRWVEGRSENLVGMGHGRGQVQYVTIGGRRDGTILAYRLDAIQDIGAYPDVGTGLPTLTRMMATGVYAVPRAEFGFRCVVTNTTPVVAYRGAGRPEASAAIERAVDRFADEIGVDPVDVRRRNVVRPEAFPYTSAMGTTYDNGEYERALDLAVEASGYERLRAEQAERRAAGDPVALGIGLAAYVEVTAGPSAGQEYGRVEVAPDGSVTVHTGVSPHGQGHVTAFSMIVADELGVDIDRVDVRWGDTDDVPRGGGTMGSRSLQLGGSAVREAAVEVVDLARARAADLLEANVDDVVLDREEGRFHVVGTPARAVGWAEVAGADGGKLEAAADFKAPQPTFPFGVHVAVVEVDTETGRVVLRRIVTVDDAGRVLNPLLVEGQRHGGIAQGVAQALLEEVRYDPDGNPMTANLADYGMPTAAELPSFELVAMETPTPVNPLGAKGIGESGTIGSTPAVHAAVIDALAHLGVDHVDMPATPERVWQAIRAASA